MGLASPATRLLGPPNRQRGLDASDLASDLREAARSDVCGLSERTGRLWSAELREELSAVTAEHQ